MASEKSWYNNCKAGIIPAPVRVERKTEVNKQQEGITMRKWISALMGLGFMVMVTGCSQQLDARAIYDAASEKSSQLTEMAMSTSTDMTMKQGEDSLGMTMDMNMRIKGMNTDSMEYIAEGSSTTLGQTIDMTMYYKDGYYYIDTAGQKIKCAMDVEAMTEQILQSTESSGVNSDYLTEITAEKDGENTLLTFTADASQMSQYVQDALSGMGSMGLGDISYDIKEASGQAVVNADGYFASTDMKMVIDMTANGETISVDMDTSVSYENPGQTVEITAPDLEGYTEIDISGMMTSGETAAE